MLEMGLSGIRTTAKRDYLNQTAREKKKEIVDNNFMRTSPTRFGSVMLPILNLNKIIFSQSFTSAVGASPTLQAVSLFPQRLKTAFQRDRRKAVFACWWHRPQTPFRRISFCGYAPFRRFFSHLRQRFLENGKVGLPT